MKGPEEAARREAETIDERIDALRRTTERIAVVIRGSRERIERIGDEVDELLYAEGERDAQSGPSAATIAVPAARPRTSCQGCTRAGERAVERVVTEGCRQGVAYCVRCAAEAKTVLERHATPYETARIGVRTQQEKRG